MPKRVIDFHDSVEFSGEWDFVKQKKERIKVKSQKAVTSQIYLTFNQPIPLYAFLYFALSPKQAFGFQKSQQILDKMRGDTEQSKKQFEQVVQDICLYWDGVTPLTKLIKQNKKVIARVQKKLYDISANITEEQVKQLLKSGLSQRKIHLDYHTNDGTQQQQIIPAIQGIDNCITIIHELRNNKYLLAFFSHTEEAEPQNKQKQQEKKQQVNNQKQYHNHPQTMQNRPAPDKSVPNPDDRPLNPPSNAQANHQHPIPTNPRTIVNPDDRPLNPPESTFTRQTGSSPRNFENPDDRLLPPPPGYNPGSSAKSIPTHPRQILNPDERLLQPPGPEELDSSNSRTRKLSGSSKDVKNSRDVGSQIKKDVKRVEGYIETKAHQIGEKAKEAGRNIQHRAHQIVQDIRHDEHKWIHLGVTAIIVGLVASAFRD